MRRMAYWTIGLGLVGLFLAIKETYGLPGTSLRDLGTFSISIGCWSIVGFCMGSVIEKAKNERQRRMNFVYWLIGMICLASFLSFGKGVLISTTIAVFAGTLTVGLAAATLQYLIHR
jgi:hypothetical protein